MNARVLGLSVYLNQKSTSLAEVTDFDNKVMLLYPTEVSVEQQGYKQKNLKINDIAVSLVEFEISFKQVFFLKLLSMKIADSLTPISRILAHRDQVLQKQGVREGDQVQTQPQSGTLISLSVSSIFFALIRESVEFESLHEQSSVPMLSLEIKWLELR